MPNAAPDTPYDAISGPRRLVAGFLLALSNFMVVLDLTIANVSIPHISGSLGITMDQGTWIITSYAVAEAIVVPLTGWLALRFGSVRVFTAAMLGFGIFSLLCGISQTLGMLVAFRIGQGICGGPIMPLSQTLMLRVFPPEHRGAALGAWVMTLSLGPATGPIIGGWISDNLSWHWIFLINVPFAAASTFAAYLLLRPVETQTERLPIDKIGLMLLVFWIGCLQIMLDIGRDHDWFGDWKVVGLSIAALVGFLAFVIWELTEEHPIVDLRIFRFRTFTVSALAMALCFGSFFAGIVVVPQWLQASMGYSATQAGMVTAMHAYAVLLAAQFAARMIGRVDPRLMISLGVTWIALMTLWASFWTSGTPFWHLALPMFLLGFGMPFMMIPLTQIPLQTVPSRETANAAGLQSFMRTMATAISTSIVMTLWSDSERVKQTGLAGQLNPEDAMASLATLGFSNEQALLLIHRMVQNEATTLAVNYTFQVSGFLLLASAALIWLMPRVRLGDASPSGH